MRLDRPVMDLRLDRQTSQISPQMIFNNPRAIGQLDQRPAGLHLFRRKPERRHHGSQHDQSHGECNQDFNQRQTRATLTTESRRHEYTPGQLST